MTRTIPFVLVLLLAACSQQPGTAVSQKPIEPGPAQSTPVAEAVAKEAIVGVWLDERPYVSSRITFVERDGQMRVKREFSDGSSSDELLERISGAGGEKFKEPSDSNPDEYYLINRHGNLEIWDRQGLITTAKKAS